MAKKSTGRAYSQAQVDKQRRARGNTIRRAIFVVAVLAVVVLAVVFLVLLSPLMLLSAIAIKLDDGGPVLFKQKRLTYHGKEFYVYKFRSMAMQTAAEEKKSTLKRPARSWQRKTTAVSHGWDGSCGSAVWTNCPS